ncbi:MAG: magnesium transporter [Lachnospiraceae bacterium]|nr:magnesium transporter [Lachnospiraceae bacterium]
MNYAAEEIEEMLSAKRYRELKSIFSSMEPADIALVFEDAPDRHLPLLYRLLPKDMAAEVFVEMDNDLQEFLISAFSDRELKEVLDEMYLDDTVDIIEEMPASVVKRILRQTDAETRRRINEILQYPDDSAGSIMTIEYVSLKADMTVEDAFTRIRRTGEDKETIYTCYVTDKDRRLLGVVSVRTLLLAEPGDRISEIMETNIISVSTLEDKENVARQFGKYDYLALPVVDRENRLVGIVTIDDAMDVLQEENTEDIEMMAAITPTDKSYMKTGVFETWKKRIPWLLLLMISATFTGAIITHYEAALGAYVVLTAFIPMLMDTGGNAGGQASVSIIRGLALGEIEYSDTPKIIIKEALVALACGITLACANFIKMMLIDRIAPVTASVVCLTLIISVLAAKVVGCTLPIAAKRIGFDPAVMASPFITTIVDAISLVVYFRIATQLLHIG